MLAELLDSLTESGFRRILIVNGHSGTAPAAEIAAAWASARPGMGVIFHDWWAAPRTAAKIRAIDPVAGHASWMENFPWTRLPKTEPPEDQKPVIEMDLRCEQSPSKVRKLLGDGSMGGYYHRDDHEMMELWAVAVQEARAALENGWSEVPLF